jgi:hypothetical protein
MEMTDLWSSVLTLGVGFIGFFLRSYVLEVHRLFGRLDLLDAKMDRILERK